MQKDAAPISLAGSQLGDTRHVCAFFNSDEEEYQVLLPFIKNGFDCGDRAIHVVNPEQRDDHLRRLAAAGIDTAAAAQRGQFELRRNTDTYLRDGRFDQDRMLAVFEQLVSSNENHGFPLSRIVCRMDWAAESRVFIDNVIEPLKSKFPVPGGEIGFEQGRLHSFRHFFCSQAFLGGASEGEIREWLGHADSKMVEHYRQLRNDDAQRKMEQIDFMGQRPDRPGHVALTFPCKLARAK